MSSVLQSVWNNQYMIIVKGSRSRIQTKITKSFIDTALIYYIIKIEHVVTYFTYIKICFNVQKERKKCCFMGKKSMKL